MNPKRAAPLCIRVHARDNVAIVVDADGLKVGTQLPGGPTLLEAIPQAHKVALSDVSRGQPILRYGHTIAFATRAIKAGSWVREDSLEIPKPPALDRLP
jgi:galactarate dehydratase